MLTRLQTQQIDQLNAVEEIIKLFMKKDRPELSHEQLRVQMEIRRAFEDNIHSLRGLSDTAVHNIQLRLKSFSAAECIQAIKNFSKDEWQIENNGHRSIDWFFDKDSRIETYLNLSNKKESANKTTANDTKEMLKRLAK